MLTQPYIYKITNLINNKVYIGQTNGKKIGYFGGGFLLKKAIKKYGKENFNKEIIIKGNFNKELLNELEIHYINLYSPPNTKNSYNLAKGGFSNSGCKMPESMIKKLTGRKLSKKSLEKRLLTIQNKKTENLKTLPKSSKIKNFEFVPIVQYDLNNNLIKEWFSLTEAVKTLNFKSHHITECCKGNRYKSNGFKWKYKEITNGN